MCDNIVKILVVFYYAKAFVVDFSSLFYKMNLRVKGNYHSSKKKILILKSIYKVFLSNILLARILPLR